jgi:hypothetical protein
MRDPRRAIASLLTSQDGECAVGKDPAVHEATVGAHVTTDRVESNFGCVDIQCGCSAMPLPKTYQVPVRNTILPVYTTLLITDY